MMQELFIEAKQSVKRAKRQMEGRGSEMQVGRPSAEVPCVREL